jgi:hypothetical protein
MNPVRQVEFCAMRTVIDLDIAGLGIIFYSPFAVAHIGEGQDYLSQHYTSPADVARHVEACGLTGFGTGSPGRFRLLVYDGDLEAAAFDAAERAIRLGVEVRDAQLCVRDLYDLMTWTSDCPADQRLAVPDGFYRVTAYTSAPPSGIIGDGQEIALHFEAVSQRPALRWDGIPDLTCG